MNKANQSNHNIMNKKYILRRFRSTINNNLLWKVTFSICYILISLEPGVWLKGNQYLINALGPFDEHIKTLTSISLPLKLNCLDTYLSATPANLPQTTRQPQHNLWPADGRPSVNNRGQSTSGPRLRRPSITPPMTPIHHTTGARAYSH